MTKKHKPRSGSLAFYPRKRAKKETPKFRTFLDMELKEDESSKPLNFLGYKVGMTHVIGKDAHEKSISFGQDISVPVTIVEVPPLKVFGLRAYKKTPYGFTVLMDVFTEKIDKNLLRKIPNFKKKSKKKKEDKERKETAKERTIAELERAMEDVSFLTLLCHTQPALTTIGKKKPEVFEVRLAGNTEKQFAYAKEKLGKELVVQDVFSEKEFVDVKAVTKGKGFSGVVKRFGIKMHRPKAKKRRIVGSIGPWTPGTVMYTVARPGQLGYQARTEYNKRILKISDNPEEIKKKGGFHKYGEVKNPFIILSGSIPGPVKRVIGLKKTTKQAPEKGHNLEKIEFIAATS